MSTSTQNPPPLPPRQNHGESERSSIDSPELEKDASVLLSKVMTFCRSKDLAAASRMIKDAEPPNTLNSTIEHQLIGIIREVLPYLQSRGLRRLQYDEFWFIDLLMTFQVGVLHVGVGPDEQLGRWCKIMEKCLDRSHFSISLWCFTMGYDSFTQKPSYGAMLGAAFQGRHVGWKVLWMWFRLRMHYWDRLRKWNIV
ncbi:MAG: hypothetical protein Q9185_001493 [Variospora sp. 1 TL-2023]